MGGKIKLLRLQSKFKSWIRQLTWPWLASFILLTATIAFYFSVIMPARDALNDARGQLASMQHDQQRLKQASLTTARQAPAGQLDLFYQAFPTEKSVPDTIEKLINLAIAKGLNPEQAQYRIVRNNPGELLSYQLTLPIKASYSNITSFIFDLLAKSPNIALDNISLQRKKIGDEEVEAILWLTLYILREQPVEH